MSGMVIQYFEGGEKVVKLRAAHKNCYVSQKRANSNSIQHSLFDNLNIICKEFVHL